MGQSLVRYASVVLETTRIGSSAQKSTRQPENLMRRNKNQQSIGCNCEPFQACPLCAKEDKTENQIETDIIKCLQKVPRCLVYKTGTVGRAQGNKRIKSNPFERKGKSDLVVCLHGFYIAIEVKKPGGRQSEGQKLFERDVNSAMGEYWLVESLEAVVERINLFRLGL